MINEELFKRARALNLPIGEYAIFGGGPLGIRNLREIHDIDIIVTDNIYNQYKDKKGWEIRDAENDNGLANEELAIEMWKDWGNGWDVNKVIEEAEIIEGLAFARLEWMLQWKRFLNREKDLNDIEIIERYLTEGKRKVSVLVPYKKENGLIYVFLQKRSENAEREPGMFGFFGGGADDNETSEETLLREIKEELDFVLDEFNHFGIYYLPKTVVDVFTIEVNNNFENEITVLEGDYGKWFSKEEFERERNLITGDLRILEELYEKLK